MSWQAIVLLAGTALGEDPTETWEALLREGPQALVGALDAPDPALCEVARRGLEGLGTEAEDVALAALDLASGPAAQALLELLTTARAALDLGPVLRRLDDDDPLLRAAAAAALVRLDTLAAAGIQQALADPVSAVPAALLAELRHRTLPVRRRFARTHSDTLVGLLGRPDPALRRAALELLVLVDDPDVERSLVVESSGLSARERVLLLERIIARTPAWHATDLPTILASWAAVEPTLRWRALLATVLLRPQSEGPVSAVQLEEMLAAYLEPPDSEAPLLPQEEEALRAAFALVGPDAGPLLVQRLPQIERTDSLTRALELALRLRGPALVDDLLAFLALEEQGLEIGREVLRMLGRIGTRETARELLELLAIERLALPVLPAVVEAARRLAPTPERDALLLELLQRAPGDARLRAFEALAREGRAEHFAALVAALDLERDRVPLRSRMVQLLAESYGDVDPDGVLPVLSRLMEPRASDRDRRAALSAITYVALGERAEATARFLVATFEETEPDVLLLVLSQIGGPFVEQTFERLAGRFAGSESSRPLYRFLLQKARRLSGEPSRRVLRQALEDADPQIREHAFTSLVQRNDPHALEHALDVLEASDTASRIVLLRELGRLRNREGFEHLLGALLERYHDGETQVALVELGIVAHADAVLPAVELLLGGGESESLRLAVIETLGTAQTPRVVRILLDLLAPVTATPPQRWHELPEEAFPRARTALGALQQSAPGAAAAPLAQLLLGEQVARIPQRLAGWVVRERKDPAPGDPSLAQTLGSLPEQTALDALEQARAGVRPLDLLFDERVAFECADTIRQAGGEPAVARWFGERVLATGPRRSRYDLETLVRHHDRRSVFGSRDLTRLDEELLAAIPAIQDAYASGGLRPRREQSALGRRDAFEHCRPERTLATLAVLAECEQPAGALCVRCLENAAREAGRDARLLRSLAELALAVDLALADRLSALAERASPFLPQVLGTRAWILHRLGRPADRDRCFQQARHSSLERPLFPPDSLSLLREAAVRAGEEGPDAAARLLEIALGLDPSLRDRIEHDADLEALRSRLEDDVPER